MLLLRQPLLPLVLPVNLAGVDPAAPGARGAQQGGGAVAAPALAAALVFTAAVLAEIAAARPHQRRVAHAADDVLHTRTFGTQVLVGESVQVEGGDGKRLRGSVGGVVRGRTAKRGGGRRRGKRRPGGEAVGRAVALTGRVTAPVLSLDLRPAAGQIPASLDRKRG